MIPNVYDVLSDAGAEALLNVCYSLGIQLSYSHQGGSNVNIWCMRLSEELALKTNPSIQLYDEDTFIVKIPKQATLTFEPSTGDKVTWNSKTWYVRNSGSRDANNSYFIIVLGRTEVNKQGNRG